MTEPTSATSQSRTMPILLGVLAVLVLGYLGMKVLGGGGSSATPTTTSTSLFTSTTRPGTTATTVAPSETFEVFTTKNPFLPLRGATSGTGGTSGGTTSGGTSGGTTSGGTTSGGTTSGGTTSGGTTSGGTTSGGGASGGTSTAPSQGQRVSLIDVFTDKGRVVANIKVNDTVYKAAAGEVFATNYRVVSLSDSTDCGRFLFGDDEFRLCKGEQVVK